MEIGSEFEFNNEYILDLDIENHSNIINKTENVHYFDFGRGAIKNILLNIESENENNNYLLPSYICESVIQPFKELNLSYEFYNITYDFQIDTEDLNDKINSTSVIFVNNYFNIDKNPIVQKRINDIKQNNIIIEDITHSFFDKQNYVGDYIIASLRKWFSLPSGAIVINNTDQPFKMFINDSSNQDKLYARFYAQKLKQLYLKHSLPVEVKKEFLQIFDKIENQLNNEIKISLIDPLSMFILKKYDYPKMIENRKKNYRTLYNIFSKYTEVEIVQLNTNENKVPLGFPIRLNDRNEFRKFLISKKIYPPIHWPLSNEINTAEFITSKAIENQILTIPCDQRYGKKELNYIEKVVKEYFSKRKCFVV